MTEQNEKLEKALSEFDFCFATEDRKQRIRDLFAQEQAVAKGYAIVAMASVPRDWVVENFEHGAALLQERDEVTGSDGSR